MTMSARGLDDSFNALFTNYDNNFRTDGTLIRKNDELSHDCETCTDMIFSHHDDEEEKFRHATSQKHDSRWRTELGNLIRMAIPITGHAILEHFPMWVTLTLVGHVSSTDGQEVKLWTAAMTLAETLYGCVALVTGFGLNSALDTLCSQAHGAKATDLLGVYLQTGFIVLTTLSLFSGIVLLCCEDIMLAMGHNAEVSRLAGVWATYIIPGFPFLFYYDTLRRVLQAQNIVHPQFYIIIMGNIVHTAVGSYLVYSTSWGWLGAAVARSVFNFMCFILLVIFTCVQQNRLLEGFHIQKAILCIPNYLILGGPGMLQYCFEGWAPLLLVVLCGYFQEEVSVVAIGASYVLLNIYNITWRLYRGISSACNVRVGNALGAGDHKRARVASIVALFTCELFAMFTSILFGAFSTVMPALFTKDEDTLAVAFNLAFVLVLAQIPNAAVVTVQGVLKGQGRQHVGAIIQFVGFYMIGIPLGCYFAFPMDLGPLGLWSGFLVSLPVMALIGTFVVYQSDWKSLSVEAQDRVGRTRTQFKL